MFRRVHALLAALALAAAALIGLAGSDRAGAAAPNTVAAATLTPAPVTVTGVDLHDGMVAHFGSTYYLYGTAYSCGFTWSVANTPWCGFGVATASSMNGPWSAPTPLFSPTDIDPWTGTTWASECGSTGAGCFNPRMIQRSGWGANDGVFILWFNSPADYARNGANAYNVMGCNSPAGPCGPSAGAPYGSYHKPGLTPCGGANGDFGIIQSGTAGGRPAIVCTLAGTTGINLEELDTWGSNGDGTGAANLAGLTHVESPGGYYDTATGTYVITYSEPNCGYCNGTGTGYATATSLLGPYAAPVDLAAAGPAPGGRRDLTATSCGGQPRTVMVVDGQAWQGIDLWTGAASEPNAGLHYEPLAYTPTVPVSGGLWRPPFATWTCQ